MSLRYLMIAVMLAPLPALAQEQTPPDLAPVALNSLSTPPRDIANAAVFDPRGDMLGRVDRIQTDEYGKPAALGIRQTQGRVTVVGAAAVGYDRSHNVLVADIAPQQVAQN